MMEQDVMSFSESRYLIYSNWSTFHHQLRLHQGRITYIYNISVHVINSNSSNYSESIRISNIFKFKLLKLELRNTFSNVHKISLDIDKYSFGYKRIFTHFKIFKKMY